MFEFMLSYVIIDTVCQGERAVPTLRRNPRRNRLRRTRGVTPLPPIVWRKAATCSGCCELLGHASVTTTQAYAHIANHPDEESDPGLA